MCGIIGLHLKKPAISELYEGLFMIQHRGQDQAGIYTFCNNRIHKKKGSGLVGEIFNIDALKKLKGNIGIGQVRYPTVGNGQDGDAQPFSTDHPYGIMMVHNGNVSNYKEIKKELIEKDLQLVNSECDVEVILQVLADALRNQNVKSTLQLEEVWNAVEEVYKRVKGSYSVVAYIANQGMLAFRDPHGIRPLIWGTRKKDLFEEHCFASESVVLDYLDFKINRDINAGEAIFIDKNDNVHTKQILNKKQYLCIFEFIYFARPDSIIDKIYVQESRYNMGRNLADQIKKSKIEIDAVLSVPDSSRSSAIGLAEALGKPYREGLVKHRYVGRTFIMPGQEVRKKSIKRKFGINISEVKDKNILLVDDSIVRGNTSRKIIELVRSAGAKKIYMASVSPPLISPCPYGVDLASKKEFIANDFTIEQIKESIGADGLFYQTMEGLLNSVNNDFTKKLDFCTACLTGKYPTPEITKEKLAEMEVFRENDLKDEAIPDSQLPLI
jgi:amidophosphoribosyltransferase